MGEGPSLVCIAGLLAGEHIQIPPDGLTLGRAKGNGLILIDSGVSRFHAKLIYKNGALWVQDVGSRNGIFVNDERVSGYQVLGVGDALQVALYTFIVCLTSQDVETALHQVSVAGELTTEESIPVKGRSWWPFSKS